MGWIESSGGARDRCRALLFFSVLALATLGPVAAAAGRGPSFTLKALGVSPGAPYFVFDSRPGATVGAAVRVTNEGDRPGTVRLYGVDAVTGQTTGAVYRSRQEPRHDVGAWISMPVHQLSLAPGQSRVVSFRVRVPTPVRPGQHLGGIVAEKATLKKTDRRKAGRGSFQINIRNLSIIAVQVNLPGKQVEKLRLTSVKPGAAEGFQTLLIGMRNGGNQLVKGTGTMVVSGENDEQLKRAKFNLDTFVPQTAIAYPFAVPGQALPAGRYRAEVTVRYGHGHVARLTRWFTISDKQVEQVFGSSSRGPGSDGSSNLLLLLLGALAILLLGFLLAWAILRRRGRPGPVSAAVSPTYVTAIHMPSGLSHEQIELVQWQNPGTHQSGQSTREEIVAWIHGGGDLRVRDGAGNDIQVGIVNGERPYIRTHEAGVWTDSLLLLPRY
ncbi:MAG TPA: DUF916 domain-containing protein [Solirubrobacterales bacterium]|nr:DUF916 domain-containing protein [Solirubrobacterales bacterium]